MNNVSEDNKVRTWKQSDLPASKDFAVLDHHHNMVRRLQLLPLSARGNQIKKNVAYLYLQHMLKAGLKEDEMKLSLYPRCVPTRYEKLRQVAHFLNFQGLGRSIDFKRTLTSYIQGPILVT